MKIQSFDIDVMLNGRFVCTYTIPNRIGIKGYAYGCPIYNLIGIKEFVEKRRPTLKYEFYDICIQD